MRYCSFCGAETELRCAWVCTRETWTVASFLQVGDIMISKKRKDLEVTAARRLAPDHGGTPTIDISFRFGGVGDLFGYTCYPDTRVKIIRSQPCGKWACESHHVNRCGAGNQGIYCADHWHAWQWVS